MLRSLIFVATVAVLVVGAVWMADNPGDVSFVWQGYLVKTSVAFAALVVILFAVGVAAAYRAWLFVRRTPANMGASWRERKKRKGYHALTRGMVAVAAGDVEAARKYAAQAKTRLDDPPLTMLLSAQAAQLAGDEDAAKSFFESMADNPDMAFLGLRGRLTQALKAGDRDTALALARRAHEIKPRTDWVADTLFDLQVRSGQWAAAEATAKKAGKDRVSDADTTRRRRAVTLDQQSQAAAQDGRDAPALKCAVSAWDLAPGFPPFARHYVDLLLAKGKRRKAIGVLEKAWAHQPHPALTEAFGRAAEKPKSEPLAWAKRLDKLMAGHPAHVETQLAKAEASLAAQLWGEARTHLDAAALDGLTARICQAYATLDELETGDSLAGRDWLRRAASVQPDPAWVCDACGQVHGQWAPLCTRCEGFDTQIWRSPGRDLPLVEAIDTDTEAQSGPQVGAAIDMSDIPPPPDVAGPKTVGTDLHGGAGSNADPIIIDGVAVDESRTGAPVVFPPVPDDPGQKSSR